MPKKSSSENVQVIVRVRPLNSKEKNKGAVETVKLDFSAQGITVDGAGVDGRMWCFDAVYNNSFTQKDVYLQSIHPVVETVLNGFNATIFAYGQSGTGKTFSMAGNLDVPAEQGIIPNALNHIFDTISTMRSDKMAYTVQVSFTELYNGKCRDLLVQGSVNLELKENAQKLFFVKDLSTREVTTMLEAMNCMEEGLTRREVKSTDLNADSSRSHSLFTVTVKVHDKVNDTRTESKLNLVDLAGSERQSKSGASGETLTEGNNINLSLTALGTVIDCLVKNKPHIPYRSSPLTMLLKDGLGGNSRTVIVGTCSPSDFNSHETVSTLRFIDRAKQIKNKPKVQMDPKDLKIHELMEEVKALKARLGIADGADIEDGEDGKIDAEGQQRYIKSFDGEMEKLKCRIEELEVDLETANSAQESAQREVAQASSKEATLRQKFEERERELLKQIEDAKDQALLTDAAEGGSAEEHFDSLVQLCTQFITKHDKDWKSSAEKAKKKKATVDERGTLIEDIATGLRNVQTAGLMLNRRNSSAALANTPSPGKSDHPPRSTSSMGANPAPPAAPQAQRTQPSQATATASATPTPHQAEPKPPSNPSPPGNHGRPPVAASPTPTQGDGYDTDGELGPTKSKKPKKDKHKKKDKHSKSKEKNSLLLAEIGVLPDDVVAEAISAAGAEDPRAKGIIEDLLDKQRKCLHDALAAKLTSGGSDDIANDPEAVQEIRVAYEHATEELQRTQQMMVKQKQMAAKIKEVADKRQEEVEQLKVHVQSLREELSEKHRQHAAELAVQQDSLVTQQNKKMEQLMTKHTKALAKERKQREGFQDKISQLEDKVSKLEQEYDEKDVEFLALQENFERSKVEWMKKLKDAGGLGGSTQQRSGSDRLLEAVSKAHPGIQLAGLNSNFSQGVRSNDMRAAHSAPDPLFQHEAQHVSQAQSGGGGLTPNLPSLPGPRAPNAQSSNFSRNFLDTPMNRQ